MKIRTAKARNALVAIVFVAMFFVFMDNINPVYALDGTNVNNHSKNEIINYLKNSGVSVKDANDYSVEPIKNSQKGALTNASEEAALKMLNNIRYIAGVNQVNLDDTYIYRKISSRSLLELCKGHADTLSRKGQWKTGWK